MTKPNGFAVSNNYTRRPRDMPEGFAETVELDPYSFENAIIGKNAASLVGRLSRRSKRVNMKDLRYE